VLILFFYTISSLTQSLRPIRVPSDKIPYDNSHFFFLLIKDKNSLLFSPTSFPTILIQENNHCDATHVQQLFLQKQLLPHD